MIQKRSYSQRIKVNRQFYGIVKIRVMTILNVNTFTIHETLFQNFINILPIIYQNKTKVRKKNRK